MISPIETGRNARPAEYAPGIARKAAIVDAAFRMFSQVGYWRTSMTQIATGCGVTRAGLAHHFPTKETLLEAVLQQRDIDNREIFFRDSAAPDEDGRDYFVRLIRLVRHNASQPGIVNLFAVLSAESIEPEHPAHEYFLARYRRTRAWTRDALEQLHQTGQVRDGVDVSALETELIALIDGLQIQWLYIRDEVDMPSCLMLRLNQVLRHPLTEEQIEGASSGGV